MLIQLKGFMFNIFTQLTKFIHTNMKINFIHWIFSLHLLKLVLHDMGLDMNLYQEF